MSAGLPLRHAVLFLGICVTFLACALYWPPVGSHRAALHADTELIARAIVSASIGYHLEYHRLPLQIGSPSDDHRYESDYAVLSATLCASNQAENPRGIPFLDVPLRSIDSAGRVIDSWKRPLQMVADWNNDGHVTVGGTNLALRVAVWSAGKNGIDEDGGGDDITTW